MIRTLLTAALLFAPIPTAAATLRLEKTVMLMRHGVRAPIEGEVPAGTRTAAPWPRWPVAAEWLTPHGAAAQQVRGRVDRAWLAAAGVVAANGCPAAGSIRIRTNTAERTIASGTAWARGFAPGCAIAIEHRAPGQVDPLFEPLRAGATAFDATAAVAAIERHTGGVATLARRHRAAIALLDRILGCGDPVGCTPSGPPGVTASADGRGVDLSGPIRAMSGTAQVLLLEYAEGLPAGWGRVDARALVRVGALHAALFDVFTRAPYMAAHQSAAFGRAMLDALLADDGPRVDLLVGHDTNVTALAALLRVDLVAPGYATGDVAPGGTLVLARLRDPASGRRYVRLSYRTASPDALRTLSSAVSVRTLTIPGCARDCPLDRFAAIMSSRLAPLVTNGPAVR